LAIGGLAEVCGVFACLGLVTALLAIGLGVTAWLMARRDLARMQEGLMDPAWRPHTEPGRGLGLSGAGLALFVVALVVLRRLQVPG
jgi:hypothetical protein